MEHAPRSLFHLSEEPVSSCLSMPYTRAMKRFRLIRVFPLLACVALLGACTACARQKYDRVDTRLAEALEAGEIHSAMVVGDSISAGFGTAGLAERSVEATLFVDEDGFVYYEPDRHNGSWVNHLRDYLASVGVDDFVNASISGKTFADVAEDFDAWVGDGADAIIVMLGTNDVASLSADGFRQSSTHTLEMLSERCEYLLVIAPPKNAWEGSTKLAIGEAGEILKDICAEHGWDFISVYDAVEPESNDYQGDRLHPTTQGEGKIWEAVAAQLGFEWEE